MTKSRLEAFSDGVLAIIITIMMLELRVPTTADWGALAPLVPIFLSYLLSFISIGAYWNNHHHMLHAVRQVNGQILWANLHLLFWLSLLPFATAWMGEQRFATRPVALYGAIMFLSGTAYFILARVLIAHHGEDSTIAVAMGRDVKGKVTGALYGAAIPLAFLAAWLACAIYVLVAFIWLIPDRRLERALDERRP